MKSTFRRCVVLLSVALVLMACNNEGVASFSPASDRVAVITNTQHLYTSNPQGGSVVKIDTAQIFTGFDVSFDPFGTRILYATSSGLCYVSSTGGSRSCPASLPSGVISGFLSYIPSGEFVAAYQASGGFTMVVYTASGTATQFQPNIDQFFVAADAYKVKRGTNGEEWFVKPFNKPSGTQSLRWVVLKGSQALLYAAGGTLAAPTVLPRQISSAVRDVLSARVVKDITSGAVSPDGTKLVFRTKSGDSNYALYALDLNTNSGSFVQLVSGANFRILYAFSPDSQQLVYESNDGGRSVWIANADGSNPRKLADNASMPEWH